MPIDTNISFFPLNIGLLTLSDTRTQAEDLSGDLLAERIAASGHHLVKRDIMQENFTEICQKLKDWIKDDGIDVIITTGGTGITARDFTPDAVLAVMDKEIKGFGELFRMLSYQKIGTSTIQSRCIGAVARRTLIFALPGSKNACKDAWDDILLAQLDIRHRPCNFSELLPRL